MQADSQGRGAPEADARLLSGWRRTRFHKFSEAVEGFSKFVGAGCEAQAEVRGGIPAIPGGKQDAVFCGGLAEGAAIFSAEQPGERGHAAARRNPAKRVAVLGHERRKQPKILRGGLLGLAEDDAAIAHGNLGQHFSGSVVGNREIGARIPVELAALGIVLDHPAGAHSS